MGHKNGVKKVRDGILADQFSTIPISIWGEDLITDIKEMTTTKLTNLVVQHYQGVKLASTTNTATEPVEKPLKIEWKNIEIKPDTHIICCPDVMCVKVTSFHSCINIQCHKKIIPYPGESTVTCSNCRRKMKISRCKLSYNVELTLEKNEKQFNLTIFENIVTSFYQKYVSPDEIEDLFLDMETIDFTYNNKKIVTSMKKHC